MIQNSNGPNPMRFTIFILLSIIFGGIAVEVEIQREGIPEGIRSLRRPCPAPLSFSLKIS